MQMLAKLTQRLRSRADSEHEQAALRIVIVGLILAYMALFHGAPGTWTSLDWHIILMLCGFFVTALVLFGAICIWPDRNLPRRLVGMLADNGGSTWYMCLAGEYGFSMIGVFLFVAFGNGFRYGRRYLFASQALSLIGYTAVITFVPYWQGHRSAGIGLLIALIVLPLYVSTLLKRVHEARAKAEEANLAKTTFLANMSHEMRTPLNGIVGVVDLLRTTALSAQQGELVNLLRHSISVMRSLVDDVLDITKIEAGRLTIEVAPFDLHACINGLTQLLRPHAEAKGLALNAVVDAALEYRLKGDVHHLRQILMNLLGNAIKFTERGEVKLIVALKLETENAVTARFEVTDTGIGIAPEALPRIFERFVQADQSTTRKYGGTGLGTTIAKQLTELMGGNIGVTSAPGKGTTFWVELPLLKDRVTEEKQLSELQRDSAGQGLCLLLKSPGYGDVAAALGSIGERYEVLPSVASVASRIDQLRVAGTTIRALVAACPIEQACTAFHVASQRLPGTPVAFIYVANDDLSVVDRARVNSIKGAYALDFATPRLVANAIHAVTAGAEGSPTSDADLSAVLKRSRLSLRILVAEDNPTNQRIISQLLESAGHTVMIAADGEAALDMYDTEKPDLAILDFNMPRRSGIEVIQAIRMMEPPGVRMPAMILSASVTLEAREKAKSAGADEFVGKPFDAASLVSQIDRLSHQVVLPNAKAPKTVRGIVANTQQIAPTASSPRRAFVARDASLVDAARLEQLQEIARDTAFLGELLAGFTTDVDAILARTHRVMLHDSRESIADLMHSLKGAALGVGASKLAELSEAFDHAAVSMSSADMKSKFDEVRRCYESTCELLQRFLAANQSVH